MPIARHPAQAPREVWRGDRLGLNPGTATHVQEPNHRVYQPVSTTRATSRCSGPLPRKRSYGACCGASRATGCVRSGSPTAVSRRSLSQRAQSAKRGSRFVALPEGSFLSELAESVRSETVSYLKTEVKDRVQRLRESLSSDEQMLLALRVGRNLAWLDLARVLRDDERPPSNDELAREAAKLRKRFQAIKDKLRQLSDDDAALQRAK